MNSGIREKIGISDVWCQFSQIETIINLLGKQAKAETLPKSFDRLGSVADDAKAHCMARKMI